MSSPSEPDMPRRRRFSLWSLLAPVALVVVVIAMYAAIHDSDVTKSDKDSRTTASASSKSGSGTTTKKTTCAVSRGHRVRAGETFQSIAKTFCISEDQLKACNPDLVDTYTVHVGDRLTVGKKICTAAAKAGGGSIDDL